MSNKNKMVVWGLGGCGTNQVSPLLKHPPKSDVGYADIEVFVADTSTSNISAQHKDKFYQVDLGGKSREGSGGLRSENFHEIAAQVPNILLARKPGDINVLVASASGGSGNCIFATLGVELIKQNQAVVGILTVDDNSLIAIKNSLNTLATLDNMAKRNNVPFVVYLVPNSSMANADKEVLETISLLSLLFSNQNKGLDNSDTYNFLNYHRVSGYQPGLVALRIKSKLGEGYNRNPITLAMVHTTEQAMEDARNRFVTSYSCEGIAEDLGETADITYYFMTEFDDINDINNTLKKAVDDHEAQIRASQSSSVKIAQVGNVDDSGFVF